MNISSRMWIAAPIALALAACTTTPDGAFPVGTSTAMLSIAPESPLDIEREEYPAPEGMEAVTLLLGNLEVLVDEESLARLGMERSEIQAELDANVKTALTRFDHVAGVVQHESKGAGAQGREAPIRASAAIMDMRFDAANSRSKQGEDGNYETESDTVQSVAHGFLLCRVRLTLEMRTDDGGLMEFAALQAVGRKRVDLEIPMEWPAAVAPSEVKDQTSEVVLLALLGAMAQSLPHLEQLYAEEIGKAEEVEQQSR